MIRFDLNKEHSTLLFNVFDLNNREPEIVFGI